MKLKCDYANNSNGRKCSRAASYRIKASGGYLAGNYCCGIHRNYLKANEGLIDDDFETLPNSRAAHPDYSPEKEYERAKKKQQNLNGVAVLPIGEQQAKNEIDPEVVSIAQIWEILSLHDVPTKARILSYLQARIEYQSIMEAL